MMEDDGAASEGRVKYGFSDMSARMSATSWNLGIDDELAMVDVRMRELVQSKERMLTDISLHVIDAGGKRIRPMITILAHSALDGDDLQGVIDIAAAVELIHSATLVHDDINDGADTRRGKRAAYKEFGLHEAIVAGDFLFARAFLVGGMFGRKIVQVVADSCLRLAEGEVMQYLHRDDHALSVDQYLRIIEGKTAYPIGAAAQVGAMLSDGSAEEGRALGDYGLNIGIAFQIVDDVLDIVGDEKLLGKMVGSDLKEGNMTLPAILARDADDGVARCLRQLLDSASRDTQDIMRCLDMVRASGGIERAMEIAREYASGAAESLEVIPESEDKRRLKTLAKLVVERTS